MIGVLSFIACLFGVVLFSAANIASKKNDEAGYFIFLALSLIVFAIVSYL